MLAVTYNILADAYVSPPFYPLTPPGVLVPARRRGALQCRIAALGADVLCLQEVEEDAYRAILARLAGYEGRYVRKGRQKPDGCATFWRDMTLLSERRLEYADDTGHVALLLELSWEGRRLGVANTHLKWEAEHIEGGVALGQVRALFGAMDACSAWIVCGDFNARPESAVLDHPLTRGWRDPFAGTGARSCVANGTAQRIDYLLRTTALSITPAPFSRIDASTPLPSETEPSDHLPVAGEVTFTPSP
jgi:mRNA deadenylase 3'-5' endonuclease subunit Ccr4